MLLALADSICARVCVVSSARADLHSS